MFQNQRCHIYLIENEILTKCNINYKNIINYFDEYLDEYYRSFAIDSSYNIFTPDCALLYNNIRETK